MSGADTAELLQLLEAVIDLPEEEQAAWLEKQCPDPGLRSRMYALLRRDQELQAADADNPFVPSAILARALPTALTEGQRIGPYRVAELLGSGGMGSVYRAVREDDELQLEAAVKLVRADRVNPALLKRFSTERRVLAALDHHGICRFLDAGMLDGERPYVLMELVRGEPLLEWCDRRRLGLRDRLQLFRKVLDAVGHAHRNLVLHRDLKSSNILVDPEGQPKLLDFGIAKALDQDVPEATATEDRYFSPHTAAPEQLAGAAVTVGCDVYALGGLLYQLTSGLPPFDFEDRSPADIEKLLREIPPPAPSRRCLEADVAVARNRSMDSTRALARALSGDLDAVVLKCLRKSPADRYLSVEALDNELHRLLNARPVSVRGGERWYRVGRYLSRHRLPLAAAGAFLGLLLTSLVLIAEQRDAARHERDRARHAVDLLKRAFLAADPARVTEGEVSARAILASAKPAMEESLALQPLLYAELALVLADVELGLRLAEVAAETASRGAMAAARAPGGDGLERRLRLLKARALIQLGRGTEADGVLADLATLGPQDTDWLLSRAMRLNYAGAPAEAIPLLETALTIKSNAGPADEEAVALRIQLAHALLMARRPDDALAKLEQSLDWMARGLGPEHPALLAPRLLLVDVLRLAGRLDEALEAGLALEHRLQNLFGTSSAATGRLDAALAMVHMRRGERDQAISRQRSALESWRSHLGPHHPNTIRALFNMASFLAHGNGDAEAAESLFRDALEASEAHPGGSSQTRVRFRAALSRQLGQGDRWEDALAVLLAPGRDPLSSRVEDEGFRSTLFEAQTTLCTGSLELSPESASLCTQSRELSPLLDLD